MEEAMQDKRQVGPDEPLERAELQAMQTLERELSSYFQITDLAFNTIGLAVNRMPELPIREMTQSRKVVTPLLLRLSNDLRSTALLASRGYAVQAVSLVSSMYEVAYTIAAIGADEEMAQQWIDHDDPTRTFKDIRALTKAGLTNLQGPNPAERVKSEYRIYRQLCLAKHANPLLQMQLAYHPTEGGVVASNGPDVSRQAIRAACFALEYATRLTVVALSSFIKHQLPEESQSELKQPLVTLMAACQRLSEVALSRGWGDNPFPGKW